jgi:N-acetyltransferase
MREFLPLFVRKIRYMVNSKALVLRNSTFFCDRIQLLPFHQSHIPELLAIAQDPRIWEFHPENRCDREAHQFFLLGVLAQIAAGTQLAWSIKCNDSSVIVGFVRFFLPDATRTTWEMGTWIAPQCWGVGINKDLKNILLTAAFVHNGFEKIVFRTDTTNFRSQKAIQQLGAICTAFIHAERITWKGVSRDAYYYELTPELWLARKLKMALDNYSSDKNEAQLSIPVSHTSSELNENRIFTL